MPVVAAGFVLVCAVCVFAAPTKLNYQGITVPAGLSRAQLISRAEDNAPIVDCQFPFQGNMKFIPSCGPYAGNGGVVVIIKGGQTLHKATPAQMRTLAAEVAT